MATEDDVLRQLQQQIIALQAPRQQQLERDSARAQAEIALRRKAAETTRSVCQAERWGRQIYNFTCNANGRSRSIL